MRIDINAGGLGVFMDGVSMFSNPSNINSSSNHLIRTLNTVVNRTGNITGGVGALEEARQSLKSRIRTEENRQAATRTVWIKANAFVDTARSVDHRVAEMMRRETESFFVNNPTLRPPNIAGRAGRNLSRFWDSTRDVVASAWNGVVEWYTTNPWAKWMIGAAGILASVALVVITGGAAIPFLIKAGKTIAFATGIGATLGGISGGLTSWRAGECIFSGIGRGARQGAATGFMAGGVAAFATGFIVITALGKAGAAAGKISQLVKVNRTLTSTANFSLSTSGKIYASMLSGGLDKVIDTALSGSGMNDVLLSGVTGAALGGVFGGAFKSLRGVTETTVSRTFTNLGLQSPAIREVHFDVAAEVLKNSIGTLVLPKP